MEINTMTSSGQTESPNDDLRHAAAAALDDVNALGVEGEDRAIILKALLQARLGRHASAASTFTPGVVHGGESHSASPPAEVAGGDILGKMSSVLNVDRDTLELVYSVDNNEPTIVVSAKKLSPNKALGARQLGQLIAAARQIAGIDEWTSVSTIRSIAQHYGRLDPNNFAASIQQMDDVCVIRGKGQKREVKVTKPGLESTAELIKTIAGAGAEP